MRVALLKTAGVSRAEVSLDKAQADIVLEPDNRVTIPQLRELLKRNGYPTRDALITARGRLSLRDGKVVLDLLNGTILDVAVDPAAAQVEAAAHDGSHPVVEVRGVSRHAGKGPEAMTLMSAKRLAGLDGGTHPRMNGNPR